MFILIATFRNKQTIISILIAIKPTRTNTSYYRSSRPVVLCKKDVLKNFPAKMFYFEFYDIFRSSYFGERLRMAASRIISALSIALQRLMQNIGKLRNKEEHGSEVGFLHTNCYFVITNTIRTSKLVQVSKK